MALLLCLTFLTLVGCKTQGDVSSSAPEESKPVNKEPEIIYYTNELTGEKNITEKDVVSYRPVAIMINNISIAQPVQTGLSKADIVYETEVEGGITRLVALYKDVSNLKKHENITLNGEFRTMTSNKITIVLTAQKADTHTLALIGKVNLYLLLYTGSSRNVYGIYETRGKPDEHVFCKHIAGKLASCGSAGIYRNYCLVLQFLRLQLNGHLQLRIKKE